MLKCGDAAAEKRYSRVFPSLGTCRVDYPEGIWIPVSRRGPTMAAEVYLTCAQSRAIDRIAVEELGMSSLVLMENAGRGVADVLMTHRPRSVAIVCGRGNNGGDGFVLARHLSLRGIGVRVAWLGPVDRMSLDTQTNYRLVRSCQIPVWCADQVNDETLRVAWLADADWVVDGLLGTGATGPLRPEMVRLISMLAAHPARKLAIDLPTGLNADTGECDSHVLRADLTCTMVARKHSMRSESGRRVCGEITVVSIGTPDCVLQEAQRVRVETESNGDR